MTQHTMSPTLPRHSLIKRIGLELRTALFGLLGIALWLSATGALAQEWEYTVRPGDNLWLLSERYLQSHEHWPKLQELNQIKDPLRLQPGQRLRFPVAWMKHQPKPARVIAVTGTATFTGADGATRPATQGMHLVSGDSLSTGADASLSIEFADGSRMLVSSQTDIAMDALGAFEETGMVDTSVRVRKGRVENNVLPQKPNSRYRITTPAAVAAVRGTTFRIATDDGADTMRGEVVDGKIDVSAAGVTVAVPSGFATIAEAGKPPIAPRPLPIAPDLTGLSRRFAQPQVSFRWLPVGSAEAYRAQLANDIDFITVVQEHTTDSPRVTWQGLTPGDYIMRVRAIDALKIEGLDATHSFTIIAPPAAPRPTTPKKDAVISHGKPWLAWSHAPEATGYHVQIATSTDFSNPLHTIDGIVNNNYTPPQALAAGRYYWRVAKVAGTVISQYSEPRQFVITTIPDAPDNLSHQVDNTRITFAWHEVTGASQYHFQLAKDADFQHISVDSVLNDPALTVEQTIIGQYYYRVGAINEHGVTGPYSAVNQVSVEPQ